MIGCTVRQRAEHSHRKVQQQLGILLLIFRIHTFWKAWVNRNKCRILASDTDSFSINFALVFSAGTETAIIWRIEDDCVPARRACDSSRVCDTQHKSQFVENKTNEKGEYICPKSHERPWQILLEIFANWVHVLCMCVSILFNKCMLTCAHPHDSS